MRILADSKDLINIIEHRRPISADDLARWLRDHDCQLVYTMTNISELAAPLRNVNVDILHIRGLLQQAESLPHCHLKEGTISRDEIQHAATAFLEGRHYQPLNPYVCRWDEAILPDGPSPLQDVVNFRLDDIVLLLWRTNPDSLLHSKRHSSLVIGGILNDRALPADQLRSARQNFPHSLRRKLETYNVRVPENRIEEFAAWLYADPRRAPGHRVGYEMYHAIRANVEDRLSPTDVPDIAHAYAVPYVDVVTMDRRMTGYMTQIMRRISKDHPGVMGTRIYRCLEDVVAD